MVSKPRRSPGRPKDDQLPERRRQEILPFAVHHFATVGYHAADLDQIAASIGCAKGTLYRYFPSKKELFEASVDFVMTELIQQTDALPRLDDLVLEMCNWLHCTLKFFDEHPEYAELLLQERAAFRDRTRPSFFDYCDANDEFWTGRLPRAIEQGIVRDMSIETIRQVGVMHLYGAIFSNYFSKDANSYEMRARQLNEVFLNGILTPQGSARFYEHRPDLTVTRLPAGVPNETSRGDGDHGQRSTPSENQVSALSPKDS